MGTIVNNNLVPLLTAGYMGVIYTDVPPPSEMGQKSAYPFTLTFYSQVTGNVIGLYSANSRSRPYQLPQNKWGGLLPQWQFQDLSGNIVQNAPVSETIIYSGTEVLGATGTAQFYYVDDMSTTASSPVFLWATLETSGIPVEYDIDKQTVPGYANSNVKTVIPYTVNGLAPTILDITRNGEDDIFPTKWVDIPFRTVIQVQSDALVGLCPDAEPVTIFDYPSSNAIGMLSGNEINRELIGIPLSASTFTPDTDYFVRYTNEADKYFDIGGFRRGSAESAVSALNTAVSANVRIIQSAPFRDTTYVWVSNPENKTINRLSLFGTLPAYLLSAIPVPPITADSRIFDVPFLSSTDVPYALTGFGGIFGTAVTPCYDVWFADAELDALYKYDAQGSLLSSIYLKQVPGITALDANLVSSDYGLTPAGIALDGDLGLWVSNFDTISAFKFDISGNFLFAATPSGVATAAPFTDPLTKPPAVETDTENNAWVTYSTPACSMLVKYSPSGGLLRQIQAPRGSTPIDLVVDARDDSFWVSNAYSHYLSGSISKYTSEGSLVSTWPLLSGYPSYITIDRSGDAWFNYGYYYVGHATTTSSIISSYVVSGSLISSVGGLSGLYFDTDVRIDNQLIEGIACDTRDRIWIVNGVENMVYIMQNPTSYGTFEYDSFKILPDANLSYYNDTLSAMQYSLSSEWNRSAQAFGDWTGFRWMQKYLSLYDSVSTTSYLITGMSNEFDIKDFNNTNEVRRFNESWDAGVQMQSYALPEHIHDNASLFTGFFGNAVGGLESGQQQIGRTSYEKIANFLANHSEVDTSNVDQLYSLAEETDVPMDDYNWNFPIDLGRIMDIASIEHQRLWGERCQCNRNFEGGSTCSNCGHGHSRNLGEAFTALNYTVSAGTPFIVKFRYGPGRYHLLDTVPKPTDTYPLSSTSSIAWLTSSYYNEYDFFHYIDTPCNNQVEGIINWEDSYTTLSEQNSSLSAWYVENGIVDEMFNYMLHKGLGLDT